MHLSDASGGGDRMIGVIITMLFLWLFAKAAKLVFKTAWGLAKVAVLILMGLGVILLVLGLMFTVAVFMLGAAAAIGVALLVLRLCT